MSETVDQSGAEAAVPREPAIRKMHLIFGPLAGAIPVWLFALSFGSSGLYAIAVSLLIGYIVLLPLAWMNGELHRGAYARTGRNDPKPVLVTTAIAVAVVLGIALMAGQALSDFLSRPGGREIALMPILTAIGGLLAATIAIESTSGSAKP